MAEPKERAARFSSVSCFFSKATQATTKICDYYFFRELIVSCIRMSIVLEYQGEDIKVTLQEENSSW